MFIKSKKLANEQIDRKMPNIDVEIIEERSKGSELGDSLVDFEHGIPSRSCSDG
jgi:hexokinase